MSWWSALDNGSTRGRTGGVGGSTAPMEAIAIDSLRNSEPCVERGVPPAHPSQPHETFVVGLQLDFLLKRPFGWD